jgi:hypothetical protein
VKRLLPNVADALNELRCVAMDLRPPTPTIWVAARYRRCGEFEAANPNTRIEKHISVIEKVPEPPSRDLSSAEAVNNAVKHRCHRIRPARITTGRPRHHR